MTELEPEFKVKIEFPTEELFVPTDHLAQWIANLARGTNDLLLANRRLAEGLINKRSPHEITYDIRAVASHAWELAKFLNETDSKPVDDFLKRLMPEARAEYDRIIKTLSEPSPNTPEAEKSFKALLASARDQASHYSEIDHKLLRRGLERIGEAGEGEISYGAMYLGDTFKDHYAEFGTMLDYQLFCEFSDEDLEPLKNFILPLNEFVASLIKFSTTAIEVFLYEHEDKLVIKHLD